MDEVQCTECYFGGYASYYGRLDSICWNFLVLFGLFRLILTKNMRFPLSAGLIFLFRSLFLVISLLK
jgi:hypothetical protein